ncbi:XTP/dITP diphosphohydrolase [Arthrobacter alpinus]|uniref:XTP/dITP diphosphohydrolase n=1 Tax=Arthrobacter alpinus TaxID=656366 RepID=A0A1H5KUB1_9MICC|nr:MazG family protein [Arthrobacter alpinus]SEE67548.1 XTP/dITP diphosphohydrolase [Arthrobacter alpinus]
MARLVGVIASLREHCPWTAALTHDSLTTYLLEESYEFIEAVETGHTGDMANELGDILLQVVLHSRLAEEDGSFELADVARGLSEKMIRRSPHVFHADGTLQESFPSTIAEIEETWERVKATERAVTAPSADTTTASASPFDGIPTTLPALSMAQKTVERAERAGMILGENRGNLGESVQTEDELGKMLFDVVRVAQERGLDAERALRTAVRNFQGR